MPVKMTKLVKLGIPGLSVPQGTHMCGFFRGAEQRADLMFPYLHEGLRSGAKCLCAFEVNDRQAISECELNRFAPCYPLVLLCLYSLGHFRGDLLIDILKTHPKVLMGSTVLDNPYYVPPDELAATR
jgi:hypothetical protein